MNTRYLFLLFAICCLSSAGCRRPTAEYVPGDSFRLTLQDIITQEDVKISLLTIDVVRPASISVSTDSGYQSGALPDAPEGVVRQGQVVLSASRVVCPHDKQVCVQVTIVEKSAVGWAGGPAIYSVPSDTKLGTFFTVSATSGVYKLDAPLTIGQLQGKPVTLVVGKPLK
jgi:hypothetical protein